VPAVWGDAMLVPEIVLYPPPFQVDTIHTPGAAIVCPSSEPPGNVKLVKSDDMSSTSDRQVAAAPPPGCPLKSATAVTNPAKSTLLLPAATT
jgi:hypothetical protein